MRDLKTLLRYDKLVKVGTDMSNIKPADLLRHLPKVEPLAVGTVFEHYAPGDPAWEGHYKLKGSLTWEDFPTFNWCDIYCRLAWGLDDPSWAGYNKKTKNKWRRERVAEAERALREQELKHKLPAGSLLGEGGAGGAPSAQH